MKGVTRSPTDLGTLELLCFTGKVFIFTVGATADLLMQSVTFVEAVRSKYEYKKSEDNAAEAGSYGVVGGEKTGKKQALDVLTNVYVPSAGIDSPGADGEIGSTCGAITELDIGGNGFVSWPPILAIAVQLPKLHWLGLDKMPLAPLATLPDNFGTAVGGLRTLWLDGTGMAWEQLLFLASAMPLLEEVHFSSNKVSTLQPSSAEVPVAAAALPKLHSLYLEGNAISRWEDLEPLGALPALTLLNLNFNQLASVPPPPPAHDGAGGTGAVSGGTGAVSGMPFSTLRHLMLRGNKLDSWASIDALDAYPCLAEARLAELPLTSAISGAAARRFVIARVRKLKSLNGSEVRPREREDAERFYLRQIAQEYPEGGLPADAVVYPEGSSEGGAESGATPTATAPAAPRLDEYGRPLAEVGLRELARPANAPPPELRVPPGEAWAALQVRHPRWASLLLEHGVHVTKTVTQASGGVLANELLEINLRSTAAESAHLPMVTRRLPGGLPLKSIKLIACQLFKVEPLHMQMLYCAPGAERDIPELLDDDSKSLADLGVVSGGTIVVETTESNGVELS